MERVIERVADAADADASELPPLYEYVDPDALNTLAAGTTDVEITFAYVEREVTVTGEGAVRVEGPASGRLARPAADDD